VSPSESSTSDSSSNAFSSDVSSSELCSSCFLPPFPFFKYRDFTGKIQKQIEAEKKGLQKQIKREQGDLTCKDKKLKSAKKKDTYVTIDDLRGDKQIKAKALYNYYL
jgi:hypothetical protein